MIPTGYEKTYLSNKSSLEILKLMLNYLKPIWGNVYVQVSPEWDTYDLEVFLTFHKFELDECEIYFASHIQAFDYIDENGIVANELGYQYFCLEVLQEKGTEYHALINGKNGKKSDNFGEFECNLIINNLIRYSLIAPNEQESDDGIFNIFASLLR